MNLYNFTDKIINIAYVLKFKWIKLVSTLNMLLVSIFITKLLTQIDIFKYTFDTETQPLSLFAYLFLILSSAG